MYPRYNGHFNSPMVCTLPFDIMGGIAQAENLMLYAKIPFRILIKLYEPEEGKRRASDEIISGRLKMARSCAEDAIRIIDKYLEHEPEPAKTYMANIRSRLTKISEFNYDQLDLMFGESEIEKLKPFMNENITKLQKMYNNL